MPVNTPARVSARYAALQRTAGLERVQRLFSQMADAEIDRLKAFLSGWAALEILIAKAFKMYEGAFFAPLTGGEQSSLRGRFLRQVRHVMKDKYRLTDKFAAVSAVLFPVALDAEVEDDYRKFRQLKGMRDSIYHGEEFSEDDLLVDELASLLRKYLLAYVESSVNGPDFDGDSIV